MIARAVVILAACAALVWAAWSHADDPQLRIAAASTSGAVRLSGPANGAILSASHLTPGGRATGTVTFANSGTGTGFVTLSSSQLTQSAGPLGGRLGDVLMLDIADVTDPSVPRPVYSGKLTSLGNVPLGVFDAAQSRTYRFTVTFPDGGAPSSPTTGDNALQGASLTLSFDWTANPVPTPPGPGGGGDGGTTTTTDTTPVAPGGSTTPTTNTQPSTRPPTTTTFPITPQKPATKPTVTTTPSTARCVSRRRFTLHLRSGERLVSATVTVNGRKVGVRLGNPAAAVIDLRGAARGTIIVRIVARTRSGRRLTGRRTYHACVPKRPRTGRPKP